MSARRHLVGTRRSVAPPRRAEYDALWEAVRADATARGAHAWRFVAAGRDDLFLEFLEFASHADPRPFPALRTLELAFEGAAEEWEEAGEEKF